MKQNQKKKNIIEFFFKLIDFTPHHLFGLRPKGNFSIFKFQNFNKKQKQLRFQFSIFSK